MDRCEDGLTVSAERLAHDYLGASSPAVRELTFKKSHEEVFGLLGPRPRLEVKPHHTIDEALEGEDLTNYLDGVKLLDKIIRWYNEKRLPSAALLRSAATKKGILGFWWQKDIGVSVRNWLGDGFREWGGAFFEQRRGVVVEKGREFAREDTALSFVRSGCSPAEPD